MRTKTNQLQPESGHTHVVLFVLVGVVKRKKGQVGRGVQLHAGFNTAHSSTAAGGVSLRAGKTLGTVAPRDKSGVEHSSTLTSAQCTQAPSGTVAPTVPILRA